MRCDDACTVRVRRSGRHAALRVRMLVPVTLAVSAVCGCSAGDDVLRGLRGFADDTDTLINSRWKPKAFTLPPPAQWPTEQQIGDEAARLAAPVTQVPPEEQQAAVRVACEAADAVEATGGTAEDAANYVVTRTSTTLSYRTQAEQLAADLVEAGGASEQLAILGRVTLCTWASN